MDYLHRISAWKVGTSGLQACWTPLVSELVEETHDTKAFHEPRDPHETHRRRELQSHKAAMPPLRLVKIRTNPIGQNRSNRLIVNTCCWCTSVHNGELYTGKAPLSGTTFRGSTYSLYCSRKMRQLASEPSCVCVFGTWCVD